MTGKQIIKSIMTEKEFSQYTLAEAIGKNQTHVTGYLNRGKNDMRLDIFTKMIEAMGYEVVVRDKEHPEKEIKVNFDVDLDALLNDD